MVKFGLLHLFESPAGRSEKQYFDENLELIEYADDAGLDEVWLAEHHFSDYGVMPSTQVFGAFAAARTKRVRIGTAVVVLPFHNPVRVAEEFAFLDQLSGGRLDFGVGRGYQPAEFRGYGVDITTARERYDESLEVIRRAWSNEELHFEGKHFHFAKVQVRPRPFQKPTPPLFGASFNPDTIAFQADKGLNLLFSPLLAPPEKVALYRSRLRDRGHDPASFRVGGLAFVYVDDDPERALRDFEQPCMWYYRTFTGLIPAKEFPDSDGYYRDLHGNLKAFLDAHAAGTLSFKQVVEESPMSHAFLVGSPETVKRKLEQLVASYGLTDLLCWTRLGGLDQKKVMRSMGLFVKRVIEPLRAEGKLA